MHDIGRFNWAQHTKGTLRLADRLALMRYALLPSMMNVIKLQLSKALLATQVNRADIEMSRLKLPDSKVVVDAIDEIRSCTSQSITNHSIRSWFWAAGLGQLLGKSGDPELLAVSCLLHDLGVSVKHDKPAQQPECACFALKGAFAAKQFASDHDWSVDRQDKLFDAIGMHMNGNVLPMQGIEAHLLQQAATCDVVGMRMQELPIAFRHQVFTAYPRGALNSELMQFINHEALHQPHSRAALVKGLGFNFYVKSNPYQYG